MGWNDFTYAMGNLRNMFGATNTLIDKNSGVPLGQRMKDAGIELFGNSMALRTAWDIKNNTNSSVGYAGFFSANGDASQAMQNTTNAAMWSAQMYTPTSYWNSYMGMNGMYGSMPQTTNYSYSYTTNGTQNSGSNFFRGYWA